jgi:hypothetical protein
MADLRSRFAVLFLPLPQQLERLHRRKLFDLRAGQLREQLLRRVDEERELAVVVGGGGAVGFSAAADLGSADVLDGKFAQ